MNNRELFPLLARAARNWPHDVAVVRGSHRLTFRQLKSAVENLAAALLRADITAGRKVGLLCVNGPEYVIGSFALFLVGGIVVPIFPGLKRYEITNLSMEMALDAYCYSPQFSERLGTERTGEPLTIDLLQGLMKLQIERCCRHSGHADNRLLSLGAPMLRFTSGTTSRAKGVIIPQSSMIEYTKRFSNSYSIKKGDCILDLLSMAHIFYQVAAGLLKGAKLVVEDATQIDAVIRSIRDNRVTQIEAAPSFYSMLLAAPGIEAKDFRDVRYITSCGAILRDDVAAEFRGRFGREIVQRYGLTETGPVLINLSEDPKNRGSLGAAAPGCEIKLEATGALPDEKNRGEILVRCPGLFQGYYKPWTPPEETLADGWFRTGDIARKDSTGNFWIVGRVKTAINVGGVKVWRN